MERCSIQSETRVCFLETCCSKHNFNILSSKIITIIMNEARDTVYQVLEKKNFTFLCFLGECFIFGIDFSSNWRIISSLFCVKFHYGAPTGFDGPTNNVCSRMIA